MPVPTNQQKPSFLIPDSKDSKRDHWNTFHLENSVVVVVVVVVLVERLKICLQSLYPGSILNFMRCRASYCQVSAILNSEIKETLLELAYQLYSTWFVRTSDILFSTGIRKLWSPSLTGHCWDMYHMCADCQYNENMDDMDTLLWYISSILLAYFVWIWMIIIPLQKTKKTLGRNKQEHGDGWDFPWRTFSMTSHQRAPRVAPNAKEGTSIRRNALWASSHGGCSIPPQWTWWKEVSAKYPSTSYLSFLLKSFKVNGWRQFVKRSNVELESTWKSLPFLFCTFSHLSDKSKNSRHVWKQNLNELTSHQHQPQHWQTSPHYLPDEFTLATCQVCWFSSPMGGAKKKHVWQDGWISHMTGSCQNICGKTGQAIFRTICSWNPKNDR